MFDYYFVDTVAWIPNEKILWLALRHVYIVYSRVFFLLPCSNRAFLPGFFRISTHFFAVITIIRAKSYAIMRTMASEPQDAATAHCDACSGRKIIIKSKVKLIMWSVRWLLLHLTRVPCTPSRWRWWKIKYEINGHHFATSHTHTKLILCFYKIRVCCRPDVLDVLSLGKNNKTWLYPLHYNK